MQARGAVETWLTAVELSMRFTLHKIMKISLVEYAFQKTTKHLTIRYNKMERDQWAVEYPAQVSLAVAQIFWCKEMVKCLSTPSEAASSLVKFKIR